MPSEQLENRQHVSRAFQFSALNQIINRIATFSSGIVIMRILSPSDVGVYAAASAIVIFATAFNDLAMNPAVIQWDGRVSRAARSGTTVALVGSTILFGVVFLMAPYFANWLGEESLESVLRLLSFAILIDGIGTIPLALLTRAMRQRRILAIETVSLAIQILVTIVLALNDQGAKSLVWGMLVSNAFSAISMLISAPEAGLPGFHPETIKKLLRFSIPLATSNIFKVATVYTDNIVVGAISGTKQLGYYQLGYNGGNLPDNTIGATVGRVSFAWFSEIGKNEKHRKKAFHDLTLGLIATTLPFVVFLSVMADDIVRVLYGEKWIPAIEIVRILAFLGGIRVFINFFGDVFSAIGKPIIELRQFSLWFTALLPSLILGTHLLGIRGAAFAHLVVAFLLIFPIVVRNLHKNGFPVKATLFDSTIFIVAAINQALVSYLISRYIDNIYLSLIVSGGLGFVVFVIVSFKSLNRVRKSFTQKNHGFTDDELKEFGHA